MSADVLLGRLGNYGGWPGGIIPRDSSGNLVSGPLRTPIPGTSTSNINAAAGMAGDTPLAQLQPAVDPGLTVSGTSPTTTSPFSPISYAPVSITDQLAPSGGGGINPLYLIIGIVALVGLAAYFMVKK